MIAVLYHVMRKNAMGTKIFVYKKHRLTSNQTAAGSPCRHYSPDVPSPGKLLHPGTEREFLCQCFQRGGAHPDPERSANLFWYDDSAEVIDSSHNTGCFHCEMIAAYFAPNNFA